MSSTGREFVLRMREDKMIQQFNQILRIPDVRSLMLELIINNIMNVIDINRSSLYRSKFYKIPESKFKLFEWRLTEFMERLLANKHYIDVHKFDDLRCLRIFKLLIDLRSLKSILREILNSSNRALDTLRDCLQNFTIEEDLNEELNKNKKTLALENEEFEKLVSYKENEEKLRQENFDTLVDNCMDEVLIIDPILVRFRIKLIKGHHEDFKYQLQNNINALEKAIFDYNQRLVLDEGVHQEVMTHLSYETETLKDEIKYWEKKYDTEYEKYEFMNSNIKLSIKAMESNIETLRNRLKSFPKELARVRKQQKMEREAKSKAKRVKQGHSMTEIKKKIKKKKQ